MPEENQGGSPAGAADTGSSSAASQTGAASQGGQQGGQGQQSSSSQSSGDQQQQTQTQTQFSVPEAFKEKGWASKVKSMDDVFKLVDNQDQLIGKKAVTALDYSKATEEEIAAHHAKLAPQDRAAYKFNAAADDAVANAVGDAFIKAGLNEYQGQQILKTLHPVIQKMQEDKVAADTSEDGYMKLSQEAFGENYKQSIGRVEKVLKTFAPDDASKKVLDDMPNNQRIAVDKTVNKLVDAYESRIAKILKEHGITESGAQADGGQGNMSTDVDGQRKELRAQIRKIDSRPHTAAEKQALIDKLTATYKGQ